MSHSRLLPPLVAVATLVLLFANALPCSLRKRRLMDERARLTRELVREQEREDRLSAENFALEHDPFAIERLCLETWRIPPEGILAAPSGAPEEAVAIEPARE